VLQYLGALLAMLLAGCLIEFINLNSWLLVGWLAGWLACWLVEWFWLIVGEVID